MRERGERIHCQELETALRRLEAWSGVTPEDRRMVARFSARLTDALVERWVANLTDDEIDSDAALELLVGGE